MSKRRRPDGPITDPFAQREAAQYANPIASREYILEQLASAGRPLTHDELTAHLDLTGEDEIEALRRRLIAMERDGQLIRDRRRAYGCVDRMDLQRGRVQGHRDGNGYFIPHDGGDDLYLTSRQMAKVFDGDEVLVRKGEVGFRGKREGVIVEVLSRNTQQVVGRFYKERGIQFVRPDNSRLAKDVLIPFGEAGEVSLTAKHGQYVVVDIVDQPDRNHPPTGKVVQVLGDHMAPGMEIDVAIRSHAIPNEWPGDVLDAARQLGPEVAEDDKALRVDLRKLAFVTIDGEDARDFDDAVFCEAKKGGGWRLWVAIADVSHYVQINSPLDREAQLRSTSVYFPDYVIPMLPEAISNGLCSLVPEVDRLTMVCEMTISATGRISGYQFFESIIHSQARLTYTKVAQILEEKGNPKSGIRKHYHHVLKNVDELHNLYKVLRAARDERGAIDFETVETRIIFDENRKIEKIIPVHRNDAHKLIEECMLAANVCAARFIEKHDLIGLFRVHEGPTDEKLENLRDFLGELGLYLPGGKKPKPEHYQEVLEQAEGRPDAHVIQTMLLRSLRQAVYQPVNEGHFGLNYQAYAHFTSPIRRYPDLLVHRALRHVIRSKIETPHVKRVPGANPIPQKAIYPYDMATMLQFGEHSSLAERRADEATRDVVSWLKCEFLQDHVGSTFPGVVTSVTGFGLFVELQDLYVEGLVHITALPRDYYHFEASKMRLVGENTRRVFRLGDELTVQVARVDLEERKVDFELVESKSDKTTRLSKQEVSEATAEAKRGKAKAAAGKNKSGKSSSGKANAGKSRGDKSGKPSSKKSDSSSKKRRR